MSGSVAHRDPARRYCNTALHRDMEDGAAQTVYMHGLLQCIVCFSFLCCLGPPGSLDAGDCIWSFPLSLMMGSAALVGTHWLSLLLDWHTDACCANEFMML